jgi:hypothetical protein
LFGGEPKRHGRGADDLYACFIHERIPSYRHVMKANAGIARVMPNDDRIVRG